MDSFDLTRSVFSKNCEASDNPHDTEFHYHQHFSIPAWMVNIIQNCYVQAPLPLTTASKLVDNVNRWDYTCFGEDKQSLAHIIMHIFKDLLPELNVDPVLFRHFVDTVLVNYPENPYHNIFHAVEVLHCVYYLTSIAPSAAQLRHLLTPIHIFSIYVAALCHDLGHPAFGNQFISDINHPLRIIYNDTSVLEQYHSTVLFSILSNTAFASMFDSWTFDEKSLFRRIVIGCILATDMANHFDIIKRFKEAVPLDLYNNMLLDEPALFLVCIALVKAADICNLVRPYSIAERWALLLMEEFWKQVSDKFIIIIRETWKDHFTWLVSAPKLTGMLMSPRARLLLASV